MLKRKPIVFFLILLAASSLSSPAFAASKAWYAQPLTKLGFYVFDNAFTQPDFRVTDLSGAQKSRNSLKGKAVLLNFWATWCPPCKAEIPWFVEFAEKYKDQRLAVLGISVDDTPEDIRAFAAEYQINYPMLVGEGQDELKAAYDAEAVIPVSWLIKPDGTLLAKAQGIHAKEWFEENLTSMFEKD